MWFARAVQARKFREAKRPPKIPKSLVSFFSSVMKKYLVGQGNSWQRNVGYFRDTCGAGREMLVAVRNCVNRLVFGKSVTNALQIQSNYTEHYNSSHDYIIFQHSFGKNLTVFGISNLCGEVTKASAAKSSPK